MRALIQRVSRASVSVAGDEVGAIGHGLLVLLGVEVGDSAADVEWLCGKVVRMRLFPDEGGVMNLDVVQAGGGLLLVSQFTLHASTAKGNRPSYIRAARPEEAVPLYEQARRCMAQLLGKPVPSGVFGAMMEVALVNDGPVTIMIDSRSRE
jgi:D-tyrosyl-tRNA(Tyr) deacylase